MFYIDEMLSDCKLITQRITDYNITEQSYKLSSDQQDLLTMPLLRICELAARFEDNLKDLVLDYDWEAMAKMRNQIAHPYGGFDFDFVWEAATQDIPDLTVICEGLLSID